MVLFMQLADELVAILKRMLLCSLYCGHFVQSSTVNVNEHDNETGTY